MSLRFQTLSRYLEHPMGKPGCIRFSSHRPPAHGDTKTPVSSMQDNLNHLRLADQTVVLGPCGYVSGHTQLPPIRTLHKQPLNNGNPTSLNLHAWYLGVQLSKKTGSMQRWQKELLLLRDSQLGPSTLLSGQSSKEGA